MEYVTPNEAEARTGIDATTIRKWAVDGKIRGAEYLGEGKRGFWRIPESQLEHLPALWCGHLSEITRIIMNAGQNLEQLWDNYCVLKDLRDGEKNQGIRQKLNHEMTKAFQVWLAASDRATMRSDIRSYSREQGGSNSQRMG